MDRTMEMRGHNNPPPASLGEAALQNVETGVLLMCKEALVTAIQDRRLNRQHLRILAQIIQYLNRHTAKAWPDRQRLAQGLGLTPATVSNRLRELRELGYLIAGRERVPEAGNRSLMVYTVGGIDHDTLRREIESYIERVRNPEGEENSGRYTTKVTTGSDFAIPRKSPPTVTFAPKVTPHSDFQAPEVTTGSDFDEDFTEPQPEEQTAKVTARSGRKSLPVVDSNSIEGTHRESPSSPVETVLPCSPSARAQDDDQLDLEDAIAQARREVGGEAPPVAEIPLAIEIIEPEAMGEGQGFGVKPTKRRARKAKSGGLEPGDKPKAERTKTGKRPWLWVHATERAQLGEVCKAFAAERNWPQGFLRERLEAFQRHQDSRQIVSGDWGAELINWLSDPNRQPRGAYANRRPSVSEIADEVFTYKD